MNGLKGMHVNDKFKTAKDAAYLSQLCELLATDSLSSRSVTDRLLSANPNFRNARGYPQSRVLAPMWQTADDKPHLCSIIDEKCVTQQHNDF